MNILKYRNDEKDIFGQKLFWMNQGITKEIKIKDFNYQDWVIGKQIGGCGAIYQVKNLRFLLKARARR